MLFLRRRSEPLAPTPYGLTIGLQGPLYMVVRAFTDKIVLSTMKRLWDRVDKTDECWEWTGYRNNNGYGALSIDGETILAHRLSYRLEYGDIPEDKIVCHTCDNRGCVNPDHLYAGSYSDNMNDAYQRGEKERANGENHEQSKLTEPQVREILDRLEDGETQRGIVDDYPVSRSTIAEISAGNNWSHIER